MISLVKGLRNKSQACKMLDFPLRMNLINIKGCYQWKI